MPSHLWAPLALVLAALSAGWVVADDKSPKPGELREFEIASGVKMKFCWIPPGEAQLGSPKKEQDYVTKQFYSGQRPEWMDAESEGKRGKYVGRGYWLGKYPVTQSEWQAIMGNNPSLFSKGGEIKEKVVGMDTSRFPVEMVSWEECGKFMDKLNHHGGAEKVFGKRGKFVLPHEDEWEFACRGGLGNKQAFYFGNILNGEQANCIGNAPYGTETRGPNIDRTTEVGPYESKVPHPWGLCDMHGNVWQWCDNLYDNKEIQNRVVRGGAYYLCAWDCRAAHRMKFFPNQHFVIGFRVCFRLD